jgi:hypothetical protein
MIWKNSKNNTYVYTVFKMEQEAIIWMQMASLIKQDGRKDVFFEK